MKRIKSISFVMMILLLVGSVAPFVSSEVFYGSSTGGFTQGSYSSSVNTFQSSRPTFDDYYKGSFDTYWPILTKLEKDQCESVNSDFVIAIPPLGCSPTVIRSDLLAEQNVPVFCQLSAIRVNPLIDVSTIRSISFKGDYPEEVAGISFHPAQAAVRSYKTLVGNPIEENIGYVVIVLKQQPNETNLAEYVSGMLTASISYDAKGAFGTGSADYYLEPVSDAEWAKDGVAAGSSFWAGKGYLRAKVIRENEATIEVLTDKNTVYRTLTLKEGETSDSIYYPGQYCTASMKVRLNKIDNSEDMARISIDNDVFWVREGSKILGGKCVVKDLNVFPGGSGTISVSCSGNSEFTLVLRDSGLILKNKNGNINVGIGGEITEGDKKYFLAYYGKSDAFKEEEVNPSGYFALLSDKQLSQDDVSRITSLIDAESFSEKEDFEEFIESKKITNIKNVKLSALSLGPEKEGIKFVSLGLDEGGSQYAENSNIAKYTQLASDVVSDLIKEFPSEKKENGDYWGEEALFKQILLAREVGNKAMQVDLINKFLNEYPSSANVEHMRDLMLNLERFDHSGSSASVFVNNKDYSIHAEGFVSGKGSSDSVTVRFGGGASHKLKRDNVYDVKNNFEQIVDDEKRTSTTTSISVIDINSTAAKLIYVWNDVNNNNRVVSSTVSIEKGGYKNVGGVQISVVDLEVREVAYVGLIPEVRNTKTEANFTFNIGIEKRAVELSPERAQKKVDDLNKTISDWEDKIDSLGNLIKGMKGACLVTSTVLTVKSFFSGLGGGAAFARGKVMDVYEKKCREEHAGMDLQECYSTYYKDDIEGAVSEYGNAISAVNKRVECAEKEGAVSSGFLESKVVDSEAYVNNLRDCVGLERDWKYKIDDTEINNVHLTDASDWQAVLLREEACKVPTSEACEIATKEMERALADNVDRIELSNRKNENKDVTGLEVPVATNPNINSVFQQAVSAEGSKINGVDGNNYLAQVYDPENPNNRYYVELDKSGQVVSVYNSEGKGVNGDEIKHSIASSYKFIIPSGKEDSCNNKMTKPYVRYYESANKQGFAAVVPIDKNKGWYAYIENDDYAESGAASAFWICNVGKDGMISDGPSGGDVCQLFQASSAGSVTDFISCPSMSPSEIKRLYQKAEGVIREANKNSNGINLDGEFIYKTEPLGPKSTDMECTDFMTVDECNLLFNVCDPVICPTSRCDLGGRFPVNDVIASGIIGSIALCLPNFGSPAEGKVLIPICLSGVHAGLDSYLSILKSYKSCLEKNIESGEYTGICDETTAIYTCEFFWGQLSPILDALTQRLFGGFFGGAQTKGGAEYLTIQQSFKNLDKSINYFKSNYMENTFRAFSLKNTKEIGSSVCKGFIGSSVPTSADAIGSLLEPESPTQFNAYFSEELFTDATVPSTSHYKVYYHIYAGNDAGAQYRVYLKNPPASSYYSSRQTILVDSGYAQKGVAADESLDFTAPSGYKELCVSINGQDECGFGSVSSSFGLNYASQAYAADQADDKQITSTKDCVTTSVSAWGMARPNLQDGVETSLGQDDIANSGIVRICASSNPEQEVVAGNDVYCNPKDNKEKEGVSVNSRCAIGYSCVGVEGSIETSVGICKNPSDGSTQISQGNWVDVGYCDKESVRCWLDTSSVAENLNQYVAVNNISVDSLVRESEDLRELKEQYKTVANKLNDIKSRIKKLSEGEIDSNPLSEDVKSIIEDLDSIAGIEEGYDAGQGSNAAKAEALSLKASVYRLIVEKLLSNNKGAVTVVGGGGSADDNEAEREEEVPDNVGEEAKGFVLNKEGENIRIFLDGDDTGLSLKLNGAGYLIYEDEESVGNVLYGVVTITDKELKEKYPGLNRKTFFELKPDAVESPTQVA
jgi:hypothetical protein